MIEVRVKDNTAEAFNRALRNFKRQCDKDGFVKELHDRKYFKSEGQKRREKKRMQKRGYNVS